MKQVLLYLPVIHAGYEEFLRRHDDAEEILLLGQGFISAYPALAQDARALRPERAADYLGLIVGQAKVLVVEPPDLYSVIVGDIVVMPDEEVMRDLASRFDLEQRCSIVFERTFLRWDRAQDAVPTPVRYDEMSVAKTHRELIGRARELSARSSDWWRQVGAVAARNGKVIGSAWNRHYPTEYAPYLNGDPRTSVERGVRSDFSTAIHAEAALISQCARTGISLDGADIYTTTFPCPACARLITEAGFSRCFFAGQYSVPDGEQVLRKAGVRLIWVDTGRSPAPRR
jgi:dCMP deaminase